jgi:predicted nucleic acid-binding protein
MLAVIDTNVINFYLTNDVRWGNCVSILDANDIKLLKDWVLCFATVQELYGWALRERSYEKGIEALIQSCRIAPMSLSLCRATANLRLRLERSETKWHDVWIAATAIDNNLTLVTNNVRDFRRFGTTSGLRLLEV